MQASPLRDSLLKINVNPDSLPLPGHMEYERKNDVVNGLYCYDTSVIDGKVVHKCLWLGECVDQEKGVYYNSSFGGRFLFSLSNGLGGAPATAGHDSAGLPRNEALRFGDVWLVDQMLRQSGLDKVLESAAPGHADTFKALVSFRLTCNKPFTLAEAWYRKSYARLLYPDADLAPQGVKKLHELLAEDDCRSAFFSSYLDAATGGKGFKGKISAPVLLDGTWMAEDLKTYLDLPDNRAEGLASPKRFMYIADKDTKLPLYFSTGCYSPLDNENLNERLDEMLDVMAGHKARVGLVKIDPEYLPGIDVERLTTNNMAVILNIKRVPEEFRELVEGHSEDLLLPENKVCHGRHCLYVKTAPFSFDGEELYAWLLFDMNIEWGRRMRTYHDFRMANKDSDKTDSSAVQKTFEAGIVLFLSARDYTNEEVASMYFETESIERSFETAKTCDKMISFMGYAMKGFDGALLLSFAAAAVQALISCGLAGSNTDAATALDAMGHSMLHVYESAAVLEEFTEEQKEIMKCLNLDNPPFQCFA